MKTVYTSTNDSGDDLNVRAWQHLGKPIVSLGTICRQFTFAHQLTPTLARELAAALLTAADEAEVKPD